MADLTDAERGKTLSIDVPHAECGNCGFTTYVTGTWKVAEGRLIFTSEAELLPGRGPSLDHCFECGAILTRATVENSSLLNWETRELTTEERDQLLASTEAVQVALMKEIDEAIVRKARTP